MRTFSFLLAFGWTYRHLFSQHCCAGCAEAFPDPVQPLCMLRFHQDRTETGCSSEPSIGVGPDSNQDRGNCTRAKCKSRAAQATNASVVPSRGSFLSANSAPSRPQYRVPGRLPPALRTPVFTDAPIQLHCRFRGPSRNPLSKLSVFRQRQKLLRRPRATAAAPAREHSKLISPRCSSFDVK